MENNLWEEALTLPKAAREAFMEDSLTDMFASNIVDNPITSPQEATLYVRTNLPRYVQGHTALSISGAVERIAVKLLLFSTGKPAPRDGKLGKLVREVKLADKYKAPLVQLYHVKGSPKLYVRLPGLKDTDTASKAAFESLMTLMHYTTGVKAEDMFFNMDTSLGDSLHFDSTSLKLIDELTSSAALPSGAFPGEVLKIGDYKCTLPTILASLHFLARKQNFLRKRDPQNKEEVKQVTASELRASFNIRTGLSDKSKSYPAMLLKAALAVSVSSTNRVFPGGWIKSNRELNGVKSDSGLLYKMGYTEKVPFHHKLLSVIHNEVSINPAGKAHVVNKSGKENNSYSFLEFRAGTVFTAPLLNHTLTDGMDTQCKREPLSVKSEVVLDNFSDNKYHKAINSLNRAHALLTTVNKGNAKTKPIHYENARNEFFHLCAKVPIKDGCGGNHHNLSDLPTPIYEYCRKTFRFKKSELKRSVEEEMDVDPQQELAEQVKPKSAKRKKPVATSPVKTRSSSQSRSLKPPSPVKSAENGK
jgi:hypothetical protein